MPRDNTVDPIYSEICATENDTALPSFYLTARLLKKKNPPK